MGWADLGTWGKILTIGKWAGLASLLITVILSLLGVFIIGIQTGNWNPTLDATFGKLIASDNDVRYATEQLIANPSLPSLYVNTLKQSIIYSIGFIFMIHYLLFLLLVKPLKSTTSPNSLSTVSYVIIMFIAILILISAQLVYNGIARNEWNWVPYRGLTLLVQNYQVFSFTGDNTWTLTQGVPNLLNQTMPNA